MEKNSQQVKIASDRDRVQIRGMVYPAEINRHGRTLGVGIETHTFERYQIRETPNGPSLLEHLFSEVNVTGCLVGEALSGEKIIQVEAFEIIATKQREYSQQPGLRNGS